jgi:hypothetical protein
MSSSEDSGHDPGAHSHHVGAERVIVERFRLESQELLHRARGYAERLRRIDLALEASQLSSATVEALAAERDQLSRALTGNNARLRALWDSGRFDRRGAHETGCRDVSWHG